MINRGNTNVTIGGTLVLLPDESFGSPEENPEVIDDATINITFDAQNDPIVGAPDTGALPENTNYQPGVDPVPEKKNKVVIVRSFLKEI